MQLVLGIETSCDETAAAVVRSDRSILSNVIFSHIEENAPYGGVVPEISSRAHIQHIDDIVARAMKEAHIHWNELDAVAVTSGPGLIGGVIVGVMTAKAIASVIKKPLIRVNHLEGHALTVRLTDNIAFPYLLLLVSGGHSQFMIVEDVGKYTLLGATLDDALGECFDKVAKMLGLPFPGGREVEKLALKGNPKAHGFPIPLKGRQGCDLSFSGLKTAVRMEITKHDHSAHKEEEIWRADICASFQHAATASVSEKLEYAMEQFRTAYPQGRHVVIAGGVAANRYIYQTLSGVVSEYGLELTTPPVSLCTDNAAMIAWAGLERLQRGMVDDLTIEPRATWPLT